MRVVREAFESKDKSPKFYTFTQNNSGGSFDFDESTGITHHVIVEATSPADANRRAQDIGIYFDSANDCSCCGSRWGEVWDNEEAPTVPQVYGELVDEIKFGRYPLHSKSIKGPEIFVHYMNGRIEAYGE